MCLDRVYAERTLKSLLKKKPEWFTAYRVVRTRRWGRIGNYGQRPGFYGDYQSYKFTSGINEADISSILGSESQNQYKSGFHCFLTKKEAESWNGKNGCIVHCKVPKTAVTSYGTQCNSDEENLHIVVCSRIVMPTYPKNIVSAYVLRKAKKQYAKLTA